jgi:hypothetical protein
LVIVNLAKGEQAFGYVCLFYERCIMRKTLTILTLPSKSMFHVCGHSELSGCNSDAWFCYVEGQLFEYVEKLLICANEAENVTSVERVGGACGESLTFKVIYNSKIKDKQFCVVGHFDGGESICAKVIAKSSLLASEGFELDCRNKHSEHDKDFYIDICSVVSDLDQLTIS